MASSQESVIKKMSMSASLLTVELISLSILFTFMQGMKICSWIEQQIGLQNTVCLDHRVHECIIKITKKKLSITSTDLMIASRLFSPTLEC